MKRLTRGIILLAIACMLSTAVSLEAGLDRYAAIAYSPSTGRYGYGNGYYGAGFAVSRALQQCGTSYAITHWCRNAWIALAISRRSPGGYGWGWATTPGAARQIAIVNCREQNGDAHVVICVSAYR